MLIDGNRRRCSRSSFRTRPGGSPVSTPCAAGRAEIGCPPAAAMTTPTAVAVLTRSTVVATPTPLSAAPCPRAQRRPPRGYLRQRRAVGCLGDDLLIGGRGADFLALFTGRDVVRAGPGRDTVRVAIDGSPDRINCGDGFDTLEVVNDQIDPADTFVRCNNFV